MRIQKHPGSGLWVTDDGRVLMPPCPQIHRFKHTWTYGYDNGEGYLRVKYRGKHYIVHRLIAETFIENKLGLPTIDHINRVKTANFVENLRWADGKMQNNNRQVCEDSLEKYGVRYCNNPAAYKRARRAKDPEVAERERASGRPLVREWRATQRALGRRARKCPDGKQHWLTDEEYNARFGNNQQMPLL